MTTPDPATLSDHDLEAALPDMNDKALVRFYQSLDVEDPRVSIVDGEIERRQLDV